MENEELSHLFRNNFDCYADIKSKDVILAMTEEKFIEVIQKKIVDEKIKLIKEHNENLSKIMVMLNELGEKIK